eukprot:Nitzschia sp. Nitz4//scaffold20_size174350//36484//44038//NITZ4_002087-RA/size174350-processed-gene-0.262-mRNA-1//1//CDS//3329541764//421//frame0
MDLIQSFTACSFSPNTKSRNGTSSAVLPLPNGTFKTTSFFMDSSGHSSFLLYLDLKVPSQEVLDQLLASKCILPDSTNKEVEEEVKEDSEPEATKEESTSATPDNETATFGIEAKCMDGDDYLDVSVEAITILSTKLKDCTVSFETEVKVRAVSREPGPMEKNKGGLPNTKTVLQISPVLTVSKVQKAKELSSWTSSDLMALELGAIPDHMQKSSTARKMVERLPPISLEVSLTHAFTISVKSLPGPSFGHTLVSLCIRHSNTHREPVSINNIALHPGHSRYEVSQGGKGSSKRGHYSVTNMTNAVRWSFVPEAALRLPLTLNPHDAYSTVLNISAGEEVHSRIFVSPVSVTGVVGRFGTDLDSMPETLSRHRVVVAADAHWATEIVAVEPTDAFRIFMEVEKSEVALGQPLAVKLKIFNLSMEPRNLMLLMAKEDGSAPATAKDEAVNSAIVSESGGYTFGVWGISGEDDGTIRLNRDSDLLAMDGALLLGEVLGQHSTDALLRFVPLREGRLKLPNWKLFDKSAGKMSMSVRNRAAMFEPGKKEETPPSPSNKFPRRTSGTGAQGGQRASWPWPTEENVIPAPKPQDAKRGAPRRISSPFLQPQTRPSNGLPPHVSPKAGGGPVSNSPFKHLQNKAAGVSSPRFGSGSISSPRATPPVPGFKKTTSPVVSSPLAKPPDENNRPITRSNSFGASVKSPKENTNPSVGPSTPDKKETPVDAALSRPVILPSAAAGKKETPVDAALSRPVILPSAAAGKKETPVDAASSRPVILPLDPRTRAMQLAKTKNNRAVQESKTTIEISKPATDDEKSSDGSSDTSVNKELSNIADQAMALAHNESTVSNDVESRDDCASVASVSTMRTSRSERLSQALRKADTTDVENSSLAPSRSQSPLRLVRGSRTIGNVSHQQARKALLEAAQKKKERALEQPRPKEDSVQEKESIDKQAQEKAGTGKSTEGGAANRLAFKAANVLALKNTTKILAQGPTTVEKNLSMPCSSSCSIMSSHSVDSVGKRRKDHPAFAKMSPRFPVPPAEFGGSGKQGADNLATPKPFSEELFSSFRHFKEYRPDPVGGADADLAITFSDNSGPVPPHLDVVEPKSAAGRPPSGSTPMSARSPKTLREALAEGKSSVCQSFDYSQFSPANGAGNVGHLSVDSEDIEPEESLHSTSARNFDPFYATGQPRYASARQSFQQQEGGYVSSLSSHTFTVQSMISTGNEPSALMVRVGAEGPSALGDLASARSTGPSMSGRSLAHSIISVSPTACAPNLSAEFENALREQQESGKELTQIFRPVVPNEATDAMNAVAMSTFDPDEEGSGPTLGFSVDDSTEEPTVGPSVEGTHVSEEPMATGSDAKSLMNEIVETILPSRSSNTGSDAPPGFVFRDSETEEEYPVANQSSSEDQENAAASKAETRDTNNDASTEGYSMRDDLFRVESERSFDEEEASFGKELKKGGLKADAALVFGADSNPSRDSSEPTKLSVKVSDSSKSHRSAFSPKEGSSSIRTGLSAIQNPLSDLEGSASMRSTTQHGADRAETRDVDTAKLPDTIHEADDEDGTTTRGGSKAPSTLGFQSSGTGPSSTYSYQTSTGASGTRGSSGSSALSTQQTDSVSEPPVKFQSAFMPSKLTQLNTHPEKTEEEISGVSSPSSSRHSRWKMKMPTVLKNVLAKASPRHTPAQTPTSASEARRKGSVSAKNDIDDDDDIFGGLEDDVSRMFNEPVKRTPVARIETKSTTKNVKQVRGRFFSSGQNRKTPDNNTGRSEARTTTVSNTTPTTTPVTDSGKANASPIAAKINPLTPNHDRSGTTVVESQVENVNSDITSSILGHPATANVGSTPRARPPTKAPTSLETELKAFDKTPKAKTRKSPKSVKSSTSKSKSSRSRSKSASGNRRRVEVEDYESEDVEADHDHDDGDVSYPEGKVESSEDSTSRPDSVPGSMFMNLGCGLTDAFSAVAGVCHFGSKTAEEEEELEKSSIQEIIDDDVVLKSSDSNNTSSRLTDLEKRVWHEWDKLESTFNTKAEDPAAQDELDDHDRKREVARGKLLEIASSALSSQMTKEGEQSYTSGTTSTDSGDDSGMMTGSSESRTATSSESQTLGSNSDMASDAHTADKATSAVTTPMLLSFSQRSLIEKFTKQLSNVGVEVLKLNRRKQWQIRYFTVSKEHTALVAHEAKTKSNGDVARCPKALLWLKKFNSKSGYGVSNIDKNGHGGMMLVDLMDIRVSLKADEENPIPKKLADKFKESALVTLEYQTNGENRSIEFRCKDNDEAQFLCTCMRVIRDLLKREQTLRQSLPVTPKA